MDKKFIDEIDISDYEVLTPSGWKDFDGICKTIPYDVYTLELIDGTQLKCADSHIVISNGIEKYVSMLSPGDMVDTINGPTEIIKISHTDKKENMYDLRNVDGGIYYTNGVSSHNSTSVAIFSLWYAMFHPDKTIGIVSNKQLSAVDILNRFKIMYEELPVWLKPGVTEYQKLGIEFDNGTRILVSATSPDAFRGRTLNLLICDEFAHVPKHVQDAFWAANYPTISRSEEGKIVIISTPCGPFDLFHKIYTEAIHKENSFVPLSYDWRCVPGRDEKWAEAQRKNLGKQRFAQELNVEFIGSINTVIDKDVLESLFFNIKEPIKIEMQGSLKIYEKPVEHAIYVIGHDPSKGTGQNACCSQVLKIISLKPLEYTQVAVFLDSRTNVYKQADFLYKLASYYNNAYVMCENNGEGSPVVNRLWWDHEYEGLVNDRLSGKKEEVGIRATMKNKPKLVLLMKKLIEDDKLHLYDKDTIEQLATFVEKGGRFCGKDGMDDDTVSGLYWACWFSKMDILEESVELSPEKHPENEDDDVWSFMTDNESGYVNPLQSEILPDIYENISGDPTVLFD
jgi:hypothetical protein